MEVEDPDLKRIIQFRGGKATSSSTKELVLTILSTSHAFVLKK